MAKVGRNEPCPCGSGRKAKRCCDIERGPSAESLARAFLSGAARQGAEWTSQLSDVEFEALFDDLWDLPAADLSLQVELPKLFSPELGSLCEAVEEDDPDPICLTPLPGRSTRHWSAGGSPAPCLPRQSSELSIASSPLPR